MTALIHISVVIISTGINSVVWFIASVDVKAIKCFRTSVTRDNLSYLQLAFKCYHTCNAEAMPNAAKNYHCCVITGIVDENSEDKEFSSISFPCLLFF